MILVTDGWGLSCEISLSLLSDDYVNNGSGNGLVPSGIKPLPGQMLTLIYVVISSLG